MKAEINATVEFISHPEPQRLVDMWAGIIVKEILQQEAEAATK